MKDYFLYLILFVGFSFFVKSANAENFTTIKGNGHVITKEIAISEYTQIKIGGNINNKNGRLLFEKKDPRFNYSQTEGPASFKIKIDENLLPHLNIRVQNSCLTIGTKNNERLQPTCLNVESKSSKLDKVNIDGTFRFILQTELKVDNLEIAVDGVAEVRYDKPMKVDNICKIEVKGGANMKVTNLTCSHIAVKVNDGGKLDLNGKAQSGKYKTSDAGILDAYGFSLENLECKVSDSGTTKAHVTEILRVQASSAGTLKYTGFPRTDFYTTEAGRVIRVK